MSTGLRRFVPGAAPPAPAPDPDAKPVERCEMCAEPIGEWHGHVVDLEGRGLMCTCRGCSLLFTAKGAGGGRYRKVPERYRYAANVPLAEATWDSIGIPVAMAFFFTNSKVERTVAFYPSPAGATESLLSLEAWTDLLAAIPGLGDLEPDVEALLVHRQENGFEFFVVPIDACYQLVGLVRLHWKGFDGGEEAWTAINDFFARLRERSEEVAIGDGVISDG
ncbi:MAG TPA: DUF5947 family protein [Pseudonocardiaceae bacterium]|nr:DUF5947 family protein [Pseudonocardiaceae bacterium]